MGFLRRSLSITLSYNALVPLDQLLAPSGNQAQTALTDSTGRKTKQAQAQMLARNLRRSNAALAHFFLEDFEDLRVVFGFIQKEIGSQG